MLMRLPHVDIVMIAGLQINYSATFLRLFESGTTTNS